MAEERLESTLVRLLAEGATGELDVRDGRKRWIFSVASGQILMTRSNLKTEGAEALKAAHPGTGRSALIRIQAAKRLSNALQGDAPTWTFSEKSAAEKKLPIPTVTVLLDALSESLEERRVQGLASTMLVGWPVVRPGASLSLPGDEAMEAYLQDLDGQRSGQETVSFAPGGPVRGMVALWLAGELGWIDEGSPPADDSGGGEFDLGFDLDALIAEETAQIGESPSVASPEPVAPAPAPAPEPAAEAAHPMLGRITDLADQIRAAENHFEALGPAWDAPADAFATAYRQLARDLHPDRYIDAEPAIQDLATELFDRIRAAWEVVGDEQERQKYTDKAIHGKKTEEELAMEQLQAYWAAEADFKKGVAAFNQGKLRQAHEFFSTAVETVSDQLEFRAYHAYTSFALERGTDPEAAMAHIDVLKNVIERNQSQERKLDMAWVLLGRAYREMGEGEKAKRCFVQALRINAANPDAQREMKRLTTQKKEEKKANSGFMSRFFKKK